MASSSSAAARRWGAPATVFLATVACFLPTLANGFVNWDDRALLSENLRYRGLGLEQLGWMFTTTLGGHYQPLTWISFGLDYLVWGMRPAGYHLTSLLLHAGAALAFYLLLVELLRIVQLADGARWRWAAAVGALFFAVHPLRVESVAWATERRDVLSGLLILLSLLAYLRMHAATGRRRWALYAGSLFWFAASLLAKAWGMTLPVVLLVLDAYPLRRLGRRERRRALVEKVPFTVLAVVAGIVAAQAQKGTGAMVSWGEYGLPQRAAQASSGLLFYLAKTILPSELSPLYPLDRSLDPTSGRYLLAGLAAVAATALLVAVRRRWPAGLAAWLCYGVMLAPVLGFAQTGPQAVADRYSYLACLPWAVLVAGAAGAIWRLPLPATTVRLSWLLAATILGSLGAATVAQTRVWEDSLTLWDHALELDPENAVAYANRGSVLHEVGDDAGALADFDQAIRRKPDFAHALAGRSLVRWAREDFRGALADGERAVRLAPSRADGYLSRGVAKLGLGDARGAIEDFDVSLRLDPFGRDAYNHRGLARQELGDLAGAIADFSAAASLATGDRPRYLANRGLAHQERADLRAALADFDEALRVDPNYLRGYVLRGRARLAAGDVEGALRDFGECIRLDPGSPEHWVDRASARVRLDDSTGAVDDLSRALALAPRDWESRAEVEAQLAQLRRRPVATR